MCVCVSTLVDQTAFRHSKKATLAEQQASEVYLSQSPSAGCLPLHPGFGLVLSMDSGNPTHLHVCKASTLSTKPFSQSLA